MRVHTKLLWYVFCCYIFNIIYANQVFKCKCAVSPLATHAEPKPLIRIKYLQQQRCIIFVGFIYIKHLRCSAPQYFNCSIYIMVRCTYCYTISIYTIVQFIWTSTFQKLTFINIHGLSCVYSIGLLYNQKWYQNPKSKELSINSIILVVLLYSFPFRRVR